MNDAYLQQREGRFEERVCHRRVEQVEEGGLRADADVERCVRVRARLCAARGRRADGKVDRGIEVQEHGCGGRAAERGQPDVDLRDEVARGLKRDADVWVGGDGHLCG